MLKELLQKHFIIAKRDLINRAEARAGFMTR